MRKTTQILSLSLLALVAGTCYQVSAMQEDTDHLMIKATWGPLCIESISTRTTITIVFYPKNFQLEYLEYMADFEGKCLDAISFVDGLKEQFRRLAVLTGHLKEYLPEEQYDDFVKKLGEINGITVLEKKRKDLP